MDILAAVIFVIVIAIIYVSNHFVNVAIYPKPWSHEDAHKNEIEKGNVEADFFDSLNKIPFTIKSKFGHDLEGYWVPSCDALGVKSKKTIVFSHGITYNIFGSLKYMKPFMDRNYNVLLFDHKNHGKSGGDYTTFGFEEKQDLSQMIDYVKDQVGEDGIIGTHGESMGAATVLSHIAMDSRVNFAIADCPYKSALAEFAYRLWEEYHLPAFPVLYVASWINYFKKGIFFGQMSPIATIDQVTQPILFIHGLEDTYIPHEHSQSLYDKKKGDKDIYFVPGAKHAESVVVDRANYNKIVGDFLDHHDF